MPRSIVHSTDFERNFTPCTELVWRRQLARSRRRRRRRRQIRVRWPRRSASPKRRLAARAARPSRAARCTRVRHSFTNSTTRACSKRRATRRSFLARPFWAWLGVLHILLIIGDGALFFLLVNWQAMCVPDASGKCEPRNWWYNLSIQVLNALFTYGVALTMAWRLANAHHLCCSRRSCAPAATSTAGRPTRFGSRCRSGTGARSSRSSWATPSAIRKPSDEVRVLRLFVGGRLPGQRGPTSSSARTCSARSPPPSTRRCRRGCAAPTRSGSTGPIEKLAATVRSRFSSVQVSKHEYSKMHDHSPLRGALASRGAPAATGARSVRSGAVAHAAAALLVLRRARRRRGERRRRRRADFAAAVARAQPDGREARGAARQPGGAGPAKEQGGRRGGRRKIIRPRVHDAAHRHDEALAAEHDAQGRQRARARGGGLLAAAGGARAHGARVADGAGEARRSQRAARHAQGAARGTPGCRRGRAAGARGGASRRCGCGTRRRRGCSAPSCAGGDSRGRCPLWSTWSCSASRTAAPSTTRRCCSR